MKTEVRPSQPRQHYDFFAALAERDALEASENVALAIKEEEASRALADRICKLRELEKRGRFLRAQGLTVEVLDELMGDDHA